MTMTVDDNTELIAQARTKADGYPLYAGASVLLIDLANALEAAQAEAVKLTAQRDELGSLAYQAYQAGWISWWGDLAKAAIRWREAQS